MRSKRAGERSGPVGQRRRQRVADPVAPRIGAGRRERRRATGRCRGRWPAGSSCSSATRRQPEPVPRSRMRKGACRSGSRRSAVSTTVSVSGRGTRVSGESAKGRPQNSRSPRIRATGSRARRRAVEGGEAVAPPRRSAARPDARREFDCVDAERREQQQRARRGPALSSPAVVEGPAQVARGPRRGSSKRSSSGDAAHAAWSWSASWAAWCSVTSASISSSRALPAITSSSL